MLIASPKLEYWIDDPFASGLKNTLAIGGQTIQHQNSPVRGRRSNRLTILMAGPVWVCSFLHIQSILFSRLSKKKLGSCIQMNIPSLRHSVVLGSALRVDRRCSGLCASQTTTLLLPFFPILPQRIDSFLSSIQTSRMFLNCCQGTDARELMAERAEWQSCGAGLDGA
jgi:hypothetical protein